MCKVPGDLSRYESTHELSYRRFWSFGSSLLPGHDDLEIHFFAR